METVPIATEPTINLTLIKYPNPILKTVSIECTESDLPFINDTVPEMIKLMNSLKGVGLAAIQVGIAKRFCILKDNSTNHIIINPVITVKNEEVKVQEGCLSLPYFYEFIPRSTKITLTYRDEQWIERTTELEGIEAQCIQHELDHLNGVLQEEKVSLMVRGMWLKKAKKKNVL